MLLGNHTVLNKTPGRWLGGTSTAHASGIGSGQVGLRSNWGGAGARRNFAYQDRSTNALEYFGVPAGYGVKSWILPVEAGFMSSVNVIKGVATFSATAAGGKNAVASIAGTSALTATGSLVVSGAANIAGTSSLTANILAALNGTASLAGTSSLTGTLTAKGWVQASLSGEGSLSAVSYATGALAADITPFTELSPTSLANAVWEQALEAGFTAEQMMRVIAAALAGEVSGAGTSTITIRDIGDTKDRIVATVDGSGNRTAVALDAD